jgi:hypothetical protein
VTTLAVETARLQSISSSFASDAEVNMATVIMKRPDGKTQAICVYREEAQALRTHT